VLSHIHFFLLLLKFGFFKFFFKIFWKHILIFSLSYVLLI
jgi:hypothetical protein